MLEKPGTPVYAQDKKALDAYDDLVSHIETVTIDDCNFIVSR